MPGGPGGEVVGRISIRVVPDLALFRAEMTAVLKEYNELHIKVQVDGLEQVKAQINEAAKDTTATVDVDADTKGVREKIKTTVSGITSKVKVIVDQAVLDRFERRLAGAGENAMQKFEPTLNLTVADENLRREVEGKLAELKGMASIPVHVDPEIALKDKLYLEAELEKLLASMQAHADAQPIKVHVATDMDRVRFGQQIDKWRAEQSAKQAQADAKALDGQKAISELKQAMARADIDAANAVSKAEAKQTLSDMVDNNNRAHDTVTVKADLDTQDFQIEMAAVRARETAKKLEVALRPDARISEFAWLRARLEAMFHIKAKISVDRDSLGNLTAMGLQAAYDQATKLMRAFESVGTSAAGAGPSLGRFATIILVVVAAVALLLPPVLALAAGLITLVPGFLAILAPIGAVMLGLDGFKKAATDAGLFADSKPGKKGGGTVGEALKSIKEAVSGTFADKLTEPFRALGNIMGDLQGPMVNVASGLSDMITGLIEGLTSDKGIGNIQNIFNKVGEGMAAAAPGVRLFTDGLLNLISAISNHFPNLGKDFSDLGLRFSNAIESITKPDVNGVSRLDTMMRNLGGAVSEVTGFFRDLFTQGFDDMSNPDFGASIKEFLNNIRTFFTNTLPGLSTSFQSFTKSLSEMSPALNSLGSLLQALNRIAAVLDRINKLNPFSLPGMSTIKGEYDALFNDKPIKFDVGDGGFIDTIKGYLNGPMQSDMDAAGQKAGADFTTGFAAGTAIGMGDGTALTDAVNSQLDNIVGASAEQQKAALTSVFNGNTVTEQIKAQIAGQMTAVVSEVETQMGALAPALQTAVDGATAPLTGLPAKVSTAFAGMVSGVTGAFGLVVLAIGSQATNISTAVGGAFNKIPQVAVTAFTSIPRSAGAAMQETATVIETGAATALSYVLTLPGQMAAALSAGAGALAPAGTAMIQGLTDSIKNAVETILLPYVDTIAAQIAAHKGPIPKDQQTLIPNGVALMDGLGKGLENGFQPVLDQATGMAQQIADAFASGADPTQILAGYTGKEVTNMEKSLKLQASTLDYQADVLEHRAKNGDLAAKGQADEIRKQADLLGLQIKGMDLAKSYSKTTEDTTDKMFGSFDRKVWDSITGVGQGVLNSYTSDLGIGQSGALGAVTQYGMGLANNMIFNVSSVDDANSVLQNQQNKNIQSYGG